MKAYRFRNSKNAKNEVLSMSCADTAKSGPSFNLSSQEEAATPLDSWRCLERGRLVRVERSREGEPGNRSGGHERPEDLKLS